MPDDMPAKRGWGHSVVDDVLALGRDAEARTVALHHHDPWRDDHALDLDRQPRARLVPRARAEDVDAGGGRGPEVGSRTLDVKP